MFVMGSKPLAQCAEPAGVSKNAGGWGECVTTAASVEVHTFIERVLLYLDRPQASNQPQPDGGDVASAPYRNHTNVVTSW